MWEHALFREQLLERRHRLEESISVLPERARLEGLLAEVDAALGRLDTETYGLCRTCNDPIETERLLADPLLCFCLDHLTPEQQRALERDLELAAQIQGGLLPEHNQVLGGFRVSYHYQAAGVVSGDYCDLVPRPGGGFHFILGDVSGKGVAASMLMAHLHAVFRALIPGGLPVAELLEQVSRIFCESTLPTQFATLICGFASPDGHIELCNAGHVSPLLVAGGAVTTIESTGLPLGMFCNQNFTSRTVSLATGASLVLVTDGLLEARMPSGAEYGMERLLRLSAGRTWTDPQSLVQAAVDDLNQARAGTPIADDVTIMALQRAG